MGGWTRQINIKERLKQNNNKQLQEETKENVMGLFRWSHEFENMFSSGGLSQVKNTIFLRIKDRKQIKRKEIKWFVTESAGNQ